MSLARLGIFLASAVIAGLAVTITGCTGERGADGAAAGPPTPDGLAHAVYTGIYDHPVPLADGAWEGEPFSPGGASRPSVTLVRDLLVLQDLNGDGVDEAAVLLAESSGGSGTFLHLAVVGVADGKLENLGTAPVGDRVQIRSLDGVEAGIQLHVVQQAPEDAACCPTQKARRVWTLGADGLREVQTEILGPRSPADLAGPEWVLTHWAWEEEAPADPEITLAYEDGRFAGGSGCNRYFAAVTGTGSGALEIGPVGGTRMACPDEAMALETRYLSALESAISYGYLAGKLAITYKRDEGVASLLFKPREPTVD